MNRNRVLFFPPLTFRVGKTIDGKVAFVRDVSSCQFYMEELITLAITDLVIPASDHIPASIEGLPSCLRRRISIVDKKNEAKESVEAIMAPIEEEFGFPDIDKIKRRFSEVQVKNAIYAVPFVGHSLRNFLLALEHNLQFEISPTETLKYIEILRTLARSPESRTRLAILSAIFNSYKEVRLDTIFSNASIRFRDLFEQFIQEEIYNHMAKQSSLLAIPALVKKALSAFGRLSRRLLEREVYRGLLTATSKTIAAATHLPLPDSELAQSVFQKNYMPPIVSLVSERQRAAATWKELVRPWSRPTCRETAARALDALPYV